MRLLSSQNIEDLCRTVAICSLRCPPGWVCVWPGGSGVRTACMLRNDMHAIAQQIQGPLGQTVVIENRPGAGTNIAMRALIDSAPDGHTLMLTANSISANPALYQPAPFDPVRDVTPIALVGRVPVVIAANAASGPDSIARLIAASKAAPRSISYGSPGNGSTPHLAVELFARAEKSSRGPPSA